MYTCITESLCGKHIVNQLYFKKKNLKMKKKTNIFGHLILSFQFFVASFLFPLLSDFDILIMYTTFPCLRLHLQRHSGLARNRDH